MTAGTAFTLEQFIRAAPVGIAMVDRDLRYVATSDRWCVALGLTGDVVGRHLYDVVPEPPERWKETHRRCLAGATEKCDADRFDRFDGTTWWVRWEITPWRDDSGAIAGLVMFYEDISERMRAEEALREAEELYADMVEYAPDMLASVDTTTLIIVVCNQTLARRLGYEKREILGRSVLELSPPHAHAAIRQAFQALDESGEIHDFDVEMLRKDGSSLYALASATAVRDAGGIMVRTRTILRDVSVQKQVESELRRVQAALERAQRQVAMGSWELSPSTGRVWWSAEMFRLFDVDPALGPPSLDELRARAHPADRALLVPREPPVKRQFVFRTDPARGPERHLFGTVEPIVESDGAVRVVGTVQDISAHVRIEQSLAESAARWRNMLDSMVAFVGVFSLDGFLVESNRSTDEAQNARRQCALGQRIVDANWAAGLPETQVAVADAIARAATGETVRLDVRFRVADDEVIDTDTTFGPLRDAAGAIVQVICSGVDISERKRAEEALRRTDARLQLAVGAGRVGLWDWDLRTDEVYYSTEWKRQLGYDDHEIAHRFDEWESRLHPDEAAQKVELVREFLAAPWPRFETKFRLRHRDGTYRVILAQAALVRDVDGRPIRMLGSHIDITEQQLAQDELELNRARLATLNRQLIATQERERRSLARELHDELGQMLSAIYLGLQRARVGPAAEVGARLDESEQMVISAIEQTRSVAVNLRPPLLDDLGLAAALQWFLRRLERGDLHVVSRIEVSEPLSPELTTACYRLVQEAVTNAQRHARACGLWVDVVASGVEVTMMVRDDGIGFDAANVQGKATDGAHLGLLFMRERAELLGGELVIESFPGRGTTVRARIPLVEGA